MRKIQDFKWLAAGLSLVALTACDGQKWSEQQVDSFMLVTQMGGPTLGYSPQSGVKLLTMDGFAFKDLNRNDSLDAYEDWRLSAQERAADLASQLSIEEIAGLMLYSSHQAVPMISTMGFGVSTYDGKDYEKVDFRGGPALVVGAEGEGISRLTAEKCDLKVSLPMKGSLDSLNASVAAGVMMYRVLSSRRAAKG